MTGYLPEKLQLISGAGKDSQPDLLQTFSVHMQQKAWLIILWQMNQKFLHNCMLVYEAAVASYRRPAHHAWITSEVTTAFLRPMSKLPTIPYRCQNWGLACKQISRMGPALFLGF